jgi:hypothetical protein
MSKLRRVGIGADHEGYELKEYLAEKLRESGHEVVDFGDGCPKENDDYPILSRRWFARSRPERWIAVWVFVERGRRIDLREQSGRSPGPLDS